MRRHGPFSTEEDAQRAAHNLFVRWNQRARAIGGYAWRKTRQEWGVHIPKDVPCAGLPFTSEPVSKHNE